MDLQRFQSGNMHDELQWQDVSIHSCRILNASQQVIFLTPEELWEAKNLVVRAKDDGYRVIIVPTSVRAKLGSITDITHGKMRDLTEYKREWEDSFQFKYTDVFELSESERKIWRLSQDIMRLIEGRPRKVKKVLISETMRLQRYSYNEAVGILDSNEGHIVIKRSQLASLSIFAGTLLHELGHVRSDAADVSEEFESELTKELGTVVSRVLSQGRAPRMATANAAAAPRLGGSVKSSDQNGRPEKSTTTASVGRRQQAAGDREASEADLQRYAEDESEDVREVVAGNPETPGALLETLARDAGAMVRIAVARNPNTPLASLRYLADRVPYAVAGNPSAPGELLAQLALRTRDSQYALEQIISHQNVPIEVLEDYYFDSRWRVRLMVAQNLRATEHMLDQLARDSAPSVRRMVACHPNLSAPIREYLLNDKDKLVRAAARHASTSNGG